jgi:hypothetical protein
VSCFNCSTILRTAERWGVIDKAPRIEVPRWQQPEMTFYDFEEWERLVDGARRAGPMVSRRPARRRSWTSKG